MFGQATPLVEPFAETEPAKKEAVLKRFHEFQESAVAGKRIDPLALKEDELAILLRETPGLKDLVDGSFTFGIPTFHGLITLVDVKLRTSVMLKNSEATGMFTYEIVKPFGHAFINGYAKFGVLCRDERLRLSMTQFELVESKPHPPGTYADLSWINFAGSEAQSLAKGVARMECHEDTLVFYPRAAGKSGE